MVNRRASSMPTQWTLAGLLVLGALLVASVRGWSLVGLLFVLSVTLVAGLFLRRTGSR